MTNSKKFLIAGWICFVLGYLFLLGLLSGFPDAGPGFPIWLIGLFPLGLILLFVGFKKILNKVIIVCVFILMVVIFFSAAPHNGGARDAKTQASIASLRAQAELFWDKEKNYGNQTSSCENGDSIFGDTMMANLIEGAEEASGHKAMCFSNPKEWATSIELRSIGYFCVDSTGFSGKVTGNITGPSCASVKVETNQ